ncbi:SAF domain-containing protein, partial [Xanthomonas hortorum]|uniref:SAF domain-containing protein n=1 Tax=Xanthomonas hortorum TaxID=56454 RepID=UPI000B173DAA
ALRHRGVTCSGRRGGLRGGRPALARRVRAGQSRRCQTAAYLNLYKLGEGPLYSFYTPYHLCHFEVPLSVARVLLLGDAVLQPLGAPLVEVIATAKRDLATGETIDGLGGYMSYGQCERADSTANARLLPMGVAEGCVLRHAVAKDQVLTYDDVQLPANRLIDRLRAEQASVFADAAEMAA